MSSMHSGKGCLYVSGMKEAVKVPTIPAIRNTAYINGGLSSPLIKQGVINFSHIVFTIFEDHFDLENYLVRQYSRIVCSIYNRYVVIVVENETEEEKNATLQSSLLHASQPQQFTSSIRY